MSFERMRDSSSVHTVRARRPQLTIVTGDHAILITCREHQLPVHMSVCYKRSMRKWMSGRLRRKKKGASEGTNEQASQKANAPEPLQPKYFESDPPAKTTAAIETPHADETEPRPVAELHAAVS